jgi:Type II secretory pathway, pullulanase PulA and related glycosidases
LLGRGIPLISMGDEMGRTQNGSKNAYDMDDKTAWLDWKRGKKFQDLQSYVRRLLQLRKDCEALRQSDFCTDYPPVSCHGTTPWQGDFFGRTLGMLYVGRTEAVYVLFNGDDGERLFTLPQGFGWRGVLRADELPFENIGDAILVPSLTAVVLKAECGAT